MVCPNLYEEYLGICTAFKTLYTPSITEMEEHCFTNFGKCRVLVEAKLTNCEERSNVLGDPSLPQGKRVVKQKKWIIVI